MTTGSHNQWEAVTVPTGDRDAMAAFAKRATTSKLPISGPLRKPEVNTEQTVGGYISDAKKLAEHLEEFICKWQQLCGKFSLTAEQEQAIDEIEKRLRASAEKLT